MTTVNGAAYGTVEDWLEAVVASAAELRAACRFVPEDAGPQEIVNNLRLVRANLDQAEEMLLQAMRVRARIKRETSRVVLEADDAWDAAVGRTSRGSQRDLAPRERYAGANLETLDARRQARQAEERLARADEAVDALRIVHRGIDALRSDHIAMLRSLSFESSVDR